MRTIAHLYTLYVLAIHNFPIEIVDPDFVPHQSFPINQSTVCFQNRSESFVTVENLEMSSHKNTSNDDLASVVRPNNEVVQAYELTPSSNDPFEAEVIGAFNNFSQILLKNFRNLPLHMFREDTRGKNVFWKVARPLLQHRPIDYNHTSTQKSKLKVTLFQIFMKYMQNTYLCHTFRGSLRNNFQEKRR